MNWSWQELLGKLKSICQTVEEPWEQVNQVMDVILELVGLQPSSQAVVWAQKSHPEESGKDKRIRDEVYQLADELVEQLNEFLSREN